MSDFRALRSFETTRWSRARATMVRLLATVTALAMGLLWLPRLESSSAPPTEPPAPEPVAAGSGVGGASGDDFEKFARTLREGALLKLEPRIQLPSTAGPLSSSEKYPWKRNIVTTIFWVGRGANGKNAGATSSAWDAGWARTFGGYDDPDPGARIADLRKADFRPARFLPGLNPFYFALPYNDVKGSHHKAEASKVIPWFREAFREDGKTVLQDRWICLKNRSGKECYAQWGDCGPFRTDDFPYVFGSERPKPNANRGAGVNVSPAVRDVLGLASTDVTDWRFVEWREVPPGPWRRYGENNEFVRSARR